MTRGRLGVACLSVFLAAAIPPPRSDFALPGMKTVRTSVRIELPETAGGTRFAGRTTVGGVRVLANGDALLLRSYPGVWVYALQPDDVIPERARHENLPWLDQRPKAELPIPRHGPVGVSSPVERIVYTARLLGIDGDAIRYEVDGPQRFDLNGDPTDLTGLRTLWIVLAGIGAAGLAHNARRRRRTEVLP